MPLIKFNLPKSLGESTKGAYANITKAIILSPTILKIEKLKAFLLTSETFLISIRISNKKLP